MESKKVGKKVKYPEFHPEFFPEFFDVGFYTLTVASVFPLNDKRRQKYISKAYFSSIIHTGSILKYRSGDRIISKNSETYILVGRACVKAVPESLGGTPKPNQRVVLKKKACSCGRLSTTVYIYGFILC